VLLAAIGIYGVMSYAVARRGHEISIRMALGASGRHVRGLMLRQASILVAAGLALGTALVLAAGRAARTLLFGLQPTDPLTIAAGVALLAAVGLSAAWLPAGRAARIAPLDGLRAES
jgi:ABC-type antimicrobial peptide transport system permease subunit